MRDGIAFDGVNLWVAAWADDQVVKLSGSDGTQVGSTRANRLASYVGAAFAFDGVGMWMGAASDVLVVRM